MKRSRIIVLVLTLALLLVYIPNSALADTQDKPIYKVNVHSAQWKELDTVSEMVAATRLSKHVVNQFSTDELVEAVLDYPLLWNIYAYNDYQTGLNVLLSQSDAFAALVLRPDAAEALVEKVKEVPKDSLEERTLLILLSEPRISARLTLNERASLPARSKQFLAVEPKASVRTPNGSSVTVLVRVDLTPSEKERLDELYIDMYPQATFISSSSRKYNCHSYAWYSQSTSNPYWMNDPSAYMNDGSYTKFTSVVSAGAGDKLYYRSGSHSAVVYTSGGPLSHPKYLTVRSKWGEAPLMRHVAEYGPYEYDADAITMWH